MDIREVTQEEYSNRAQIKGITAINHRIRAQMKLSMEEYVMMDFLYSWANTETKVATFLDYYRGTGYVAENIQILMQRMKDRGLLSKHPTKEGFIAVCAEWHANFDTNDLSEKLWKIHPRGNKNLVKDRLPRVLRKITYEELEQKLKRYIAWCKSIDRSIKDLSSWLNVKNEHWNDPIGSVKSTTVNQRKVSFKQS